MGCGSNSSNSWSSGLPSVLSTICTAVSLSKAGTLSCRSEQAGAAWRRRRGGGGVEEAAAAAGWPPRACVHPQLLHRCQGCAGRRGGLLLLLPAPSRVLPYTPPPPLHLKENKLAKTRKEGRRRRGPLTCSFSSSLMNSGLSTSTRVENCWPILMKVGPSLTRPSRSQAASAARCPLTAPSLIPSLPYHHFCSCVRGWEGERNGKRTKTS